jgi:iron complex transport system ATP-binding protein
VTAAIEFEKVSAGYREKTILKDLSFDIPAREIAAVIGPNGAGKTTLLRAITALIHPSRGSVRLFGKDVTRLPASTRSRLVGVVPQQMETPMAFTVAEIVMMGRTSALSRWRHPSAEDRRAVERAMVYTDVADMKHRLFSELSGGEGQRAVIAMVLAQQPSIMLLDEATSHLDMNHRLEIMQIVERLNREQGVTVVVVSHDLNLAAEFCDRLLLFDDGRLVCDGAPEEVLREDTLREVYHCDVRVRQDPARGTITVVPAPRLAPERSGQGLHIHVIAGGGTGAEVLRRLSLCGYTITCGVLNRGDSDADVASALGIETVLEKPFSPVARAVLDSAREMAGCADAVVVCGVPFGPGNVVNLDLAAEALADGKPVLIRAGVDARDYTPGRLAAAKARSLTERGGTAWQGITDLLQSIPRRKEGDMPRDAEKGEGA